MSRPRSGATFRGFGTPGGSALVGTLPLKGEIAAHEGISPASSEGVRLTPAISPLRGSVPTSAEPPGVPNPRNVAPERGLDMTDRTSASVYHPRRDHHGQP